jgi:flagellar protein FliS
MMNNPYQQYKQTAINTARPEDLVLMLYEGGIKFINKAVIAINDKNVQEAHACIKRTEDIVEQLMLGLDFKRGGQIATDLEALYDYMKRRLIEANIKKDISILEEMLGMFRDFRETWMQAIKLAKTKQPAQPVQSAMAL